MTEKSITITHNVTCKQIVKYEDISVTLYDLTDDEAIAGINFHQQAKHKTKPESNIWIVHGGGGEEFDVHGLCDTHTVMKYVNMYLKRTPEFFKEGYNTIITATPESPSNLKGCSCKSPARKTTARKTTTRRTTARKTASRKTVRRA